MSQIKVGDTVWVPAMVSRISSEGTLGIDVTPGWWSPDAVQLRSTDVPRDVRCDGCTHYKPRQSMSGMCLWFEAHTYADHACKAWEPRE